MVAVNGILRREIDMEKLEFKVIWHRECFPRSKIQDCHNFYFETVIMFFFYFFFSGTTRLGGKF